MPNDKSVTRARIKLVLLLLLFSSPFAGAYVAFYFWKPAGTVNYGELMPTTIVPLANMQGVSPGAAEAIKDKWVLLTVDSGQCEADCQQKLYLTRQVRLAQGKHMDRVARAYVIDGGALPSDDTMKRLDGAAVFRGGPDVLKTLPAVDGQHAHVYLIDPLGNLVLRYPANPVAKGMIKDLTRLLTVSKLGL